MVTKRKRTWTNGSVPLALALALCAGPAAAASPARAALSARAVAAEGELADVPEGIDLSAATGAPAGRVRVMVELVEPAAAVAYGNALRANPKASPALATSAAVAAGKSQLAAVEAAQARLDARLGSLAVRPAELFRVQKALNGIALEVDAAQLGALRKLEGVRRVVPLYLEQPTNSTSVPFIGAPSVWANTIGLPAGADGTNVRIGIIDTGIDYLHADFGGTGLLADYQAAKTATTSFTTTGGVFPTAKVVGGKDFAGDAYTGSNAPVPDANPMDCNGHGSHVSGTAAGLGVNSDGTTFTGPYDANASTYSSLRIGPGVAPRALLYGLRVFGCAGSTGLTTQAIDWAMDPNGDSDLSDHLDVINMSLGSNFGSVLSATAVSADNAALAGVVVVTSAGNSGDTFFISGSPGSGSRVIATAASIDNELSSVAVKVNAPASIAGGYMGGAASFGPALTPTGVTGSVVVALDPADGAGALTTDGCSALTNAAAVAGNIALIDRGTCGFTIKVKNAQNAGAIGVIIADNTVGWPPPGLGGADATITIPSLRVTQGDGNTFKASIAGMNATLYGGSSADNVAYFSSRGPRRIFGSPVRLKPDIAAPGYSITSVQTGITCTVATGCTGVSDPSGILAGSQPLVLSGTSMASPHMAGVMALLRQLHPDWQVEELKALALNYAGHDVTLFPDATLPRVGPSRTGAGRVDPALSALGKVVAMNADDVGLVAVTFDPEVVGTRTQTKAVRLVNKGTTSQTYDLSFDLTNAPDGVSFSLPGGSSVTVPAGDAVVFDVQVSATSSLMKAKREPSLFPTQGVHASYGDQARSFLTEAEGYLTFKQAGSTKLRLPVYMAERAASAMSGPATITTGGAPTGSTTLPLSGTPLCTGTLAAGPTCTGTFPTDLESLVTPLELQVVSPRDPVNATDFADLQYAGAAYYQAAGTPSITNDLVLFGLSTWGDWSTPTDVAFNVCVDTNNDGIYEKIVYNSQPSIFVSGASPVDTFMRMVRDTTTNTSTLLGLGSYANLVSPAAFDSYLHLSNVMVLGATPSQLGIASTATTFIKYKVVVCPGSSQGCGRTTTGDRCSPAPGTYYDIAMGPYTFSWGSKGLDFGGAVLAEDLPGASLPVTWNTANMTANGTLGALLLHHHNKAGTRAQVIPLDTAQRADLAVTGSVVPANPTLGQDVTLTATVTNNGPNAATGVVVALTAATSLVYVSDDGAGAFVPATGLWTVGSLANGASATIHVVVTATSSSQACATAGIGAGSPLDPVPANDQTTVCVLAPRSADLSVSVAAGSPTVLVGAPVTYTLTVTNTGADPAYAIDVQDAFPAFPTLQATSATPSQGLFDAATGLWNLASLGKGASATLALTFTAPNTAGQVSHQATVGASTSDPNTGNNTANAAVTVLSPATITATKTATGLFKVGGWVRYTLVLSNSAAYDQQDNAGNELVDVLPPELALTTATATSGTAVALVATNTVTWNGIVPAHGSVTITINATIVGGSPAAPIVNQASFSFDADGNGTNESTGLTVGSGPGGVTPLGLEFEKIPTLSTVGLVALLAALALAGVAVLRKSLP